MHAGKCSKPQWCMLGDCSPEGPPFGAKAACNQK